MNDGGASRGCAWGDYDNDGDIDLFVANSGNQTNLLYTNNGDGTFTKVTHGDIVNTTSYWQDCSWTDYDRDGALDLFVTNPSTLYHNEGNSNHWIVIHCIGTFSNRSAVGTRVSIQANTGDWQYQALMGATGRCSQSDPNIHFGLESATSIAEMRVKWPSSGIVQVFQNVGVDQYMTVVEPVQPAIAALIDRVQELVTSGELSHGRGNGLTSKLEAAIRQSDRGNDHTVINQLQAFINQVNAFVSSGKLTSQAGQRLLDAANRIVAALQMENGFAKRGEAEQPAALFLEQNYPNPFNASTTIRYEIPEVRGQKSEVRRVTLKVFNLLGREVATLVDEVQDAGFKSVRFDASGLATGVYLYRLQSGDVVETKRLVLLR